MNKRALWSCVLLVGVVAIGCGGDDEDNQPTAGTGGFGGTGGTGGVSGGGAGGAGGAAGTTMTVMPIMCGTTTCQPPQSPFAMFGALLGGAVPTPVPCCLTGAANPCGLSPMAGGMCEPPAMMDPRCAPVAIMAPPGLPIPPNAGAGLGFGCCTAMNRCGVDGSAFGRGCVDNMEATTMLSSLPLIGGFIRVPAPKGCDEPLPVAGAGGTGGVGGGDEDAGVP